ncbi:MAG: sulfite exporter TauE/SafE family protein [Haloarculaceae archaeon]
MTASGTARPASLGVFLLIGLLGGAHCLGMCGPLVTTYADRMRAAERDGASRAGGSGRADGGGPTARLSVGMVRQHGLFNLGRTISYTALGGLFGLAGSLVFVSAAELSTAFRTLHIVTGLVVGVAIIAAGVSYLLRGRTLSLPGESLLTPVTAAIQTRLTDHVDDYVTGPGIVALGAVHGLLPCPLLYPAFLAAFAGASAVDGALSLAALGVGTVPSLFLYGTLFQSVSTTTRLRLHRGLGVAFVLLGYIPLRHALVQLGVSLPGFPIPIYQPL